MKNITTLLLSVMTANLLQAQITFQKTLGTASAESGTACLQTTDGGFISAGNGDVWGEIFMVKTDEEGNLGWAKNYLFNGASYSEVRHVLQSGDGGFLINGYGETTGSNNDIFIIKTDSLGNLLWSRTFGGSSEDYSYRADETSDSGFVIVGSTNGLTCLLLKIDNSGNFMWSKIYNGASEGFDVKQTTDGGFCIASSVGDAGGKYDMLLIKTDSAGNFLWAKSYGAGNWEDAWNISQTSDGGYILSGEGGDLFSNAFDFLLIRTDNTGNLIWARTFGGPGWEFPTWVALTPDGGFASGGTWDYANISDYYLIKTDSTGNLQWSKRYGGAGYETSWGCGQVTDDGGFIMTTGSWSFGTADVYLIKADNNGVSGCFENTATSNINTPSIQVLVPVITVSSAGSISTELPFVSSGGIDSTICFSNTTAVNNISGPVNNISIYPNPLSNATTISFSLSQQETLSLIVIDVNGRLIKTLTIDEFSQGIHNIEWSTENVESGIYFLQFQSSGNQQTEKLIVTK